MNTNCIHKKHNAEYARLKARPTGYYPKARLYVIASYHASFNSETGMILPPQMEGMQILQVQKAINAMP